MTLSAWTGFDQDFPDAGQPAEYPAGSQEAEPYTFLREDPQPDGSILVTERRQVGGTIYRHRIPARKAEWYYGFGFGDGFVGRTFGPYPTHQAAKTAAVAAGWGDHPRLMIRHE